MTKEKCAITGKHFDKSELVPASAIRKNLMAFIKTDHPELSDKAYISQQALREYRAKYLQQIIDAEAGEADKVEREVIKAMTDEELLANQQPDDEYISFGQRMADRVAAFGGSWTFIIFFGLVLVAWIFTNSVLLMHRAFDPYPYILLNLILSCLAALQAPVIMMSQNRQEAKDRQRSEYDYKVNLKAELEIRMLHEKLDHLMIIQMQKIMEFQQLQMDYMEELGERLNKAQGK